ncbi:unnamed protein product [Caretta caretta]
MTARLSHLDPHIGPREVAEINPDNKVFQFSYLRPGKEIACLGVSAVPKVVLVNGSMDLLTQLTLLDLTLDMEKTTGASGQLHSPSNGLAQVAKMPTKQMP